MVEHVAARVLHRVGGVNDVTKPNIPAQKGTGGRSRRVVYGTALRESLNEIQNKTSLAPTRKD